MTPFSQYKGWLAEGGIRNALIMSGPAVKRPKGSINHGVMHVGDLMPTLLDIAGANYPATLNSRVLPALMGKSWMNVLANKSDSPRTSQDYLAWELFGNRAVRQGDWKIRWQIKPMGLSEWELFDLSKDIAERINLAKQHPQKLKVMIALWDDYVRRNNVILPDRSPYETLENTMPQRVPDDPGFPPLIYKKQFVPPANMVDGDKK